MDIKENMISRERMPFSKTRLSRISYEVARSFLEARICVKNAGGTGNDLIFEYISDKECIKTTPEWFKKDGVGYLLKSIAGRIEFSVICVRAGILKIYLQSEYKKHDKKMIPVWLDYNYLSIGGKKVITQPVSVWHDTPFRFEQTVKDGEKLKLVISWQPHAWKVESMKDTVYELQEMYLDRILPPPPSSSEHTGVQPKETENKLLTFSILGTCCARDMIGVAGFKVNRFVQDVNPISLLHRSFFNDGFKLDEKNIVNYLVDPKLNNFFRRNTILDFNKSVYEYFFEVKSDWLVIDAGVLRHKVLIDEKHDAAVTDVHLNRIKCKYDENVCRMVSTVDLNELDFRTCMDTYIKNILQEYAEDKIIVLEIYMVPYFVDRARYCIHKTKEDIKLKNISISRGYEYLKLKLKGAHFIPFLDNIPADMAHKWGLNQLHYVKEYYEYAGLATRLISKRLPYKEEEKKIGLLKQYYQKKIEYEYFC